MDVSNLVGLVSGLLAIFTFLTGITSARELAHSRGGQPAAVSPGRRSQLRLVLVLSIPVFALSMVITLSQGLAGSDTGGAQFLLLAAGAILLLLYGVLLRRTWPWARFFLACVIVLGSLGFVFGIISRGEEAESTVAGLVIGAAVGLLALAIPAQTPERTAGTAPRFPGSPDPEASREREILHYAHAADGQVTVAAVALHTSLSLDQSQDMLDKLAARNFCQRIPIPSGAVIYRFPDLGTHRGP